LSYQSVAEISGLSSRTRRNYPSLYPTYVGIST